MFLVCLSVGERKCRLIKEKEREQEFVAGFYNENDGRKLLRTTGVYGANRNNVDGGGEVKDRSKLRMGLDKRSPNELRRREDEVDSEARGRNVE